MVEAPQQQGGWEEGVGRGRQGTGFLVVDVIASSAGGRSSARPERHGRVGDTSEARRQCRRRACGITHVDRCPMLRPPGGRRG